MPTSVQEQRKFAVRSRTRQNSIRSLASTSPSWPTARSSSVASSAARAAEPAPSATTWTTRPAASSPWSGRASEDEVLNSLTIWLCASCYSCTVECPREIKITDVMYALKQEAIAQGVYPKRFPIPVLAQEFFRGVERTGRNSEGPLMVRFFLKTNPFGMLKNATHGHAALAQGAALLV